jgi:curved DNA-binding protein CbpA
MQHLTRTSKIVGQRCQPKLLFTKQINCFAVQQFDIKKNYYGTLGVQQNSSAADIKKAFYKLAKQYHPDVNKGNADKFKEINEAYEVLSDNSKKRDYDDMRKASSTSGSSGYSSSSSYGSSSNASSTGKATGYNPYTANQGQSYGNATGGYYQKGDQNGYYQYDEEMRKQFFKNFYSEQSKDFDNMMKKNQQKYGSKTASPGSNQNNYKSFDDYFSNVNSEFNRNQANQANKSQNSNSRANSQDNYKAFQDEMYKRYKDEEYNRMEEMARLRRKKEEEFMKDAEQKVQEFMGKVDGAKKFAKNLASNLQGFFKSK